MTVRTETPKKNAEIKPEAQTAVVSGKGPGGAAWKEMAELMSSSATGAGFYLKRECQVGALVSVMLPLPAHLRAFDHEKELYRVWGLVQHCHAVKTDGRAGFHVGVAFIGKDAPKSYDRSPSQTYRICGMSPDGLWRIEEAKTAFKQRKHFRFRMAVDLYLAILDEKQRTIGGERTTTENVSKSGAAIFTSLDIGVGDRVKFVCTQYDFSGLAVVCNRQESGGAEPAKLHLQFVDNLFPVERVKQETAAEKA